MFMSYHSVARSPRATHVESIPKQANTYKGSCGVGTNALDDKDRDGKGSMKVASEEFE